MARIRMTVIAVAIAILFGFADLVHAVVHGAHDFNWRAEVPGMLQIHRLARHGYPRAVQVAIDKGADVTVQTEQGLTPLHYAIAGGNPLVVRHLLDAGAPVNALSDVVGTPLCVATVMNKSDLTELLLKRGARVDLPCIGGRNVLHEAVRYSPKSLALLLQHGAGQLVNERDEHGDTPFLLAVKQLGDGRDPGEGAVLSQLLALQGVDVNVADADGRTPLHIAANAGMLPTVQMLLARGAVVDAVATAGKTPLHEVFAEPAQRSVWRDYRGFGPRDRPQREVAAALLRAGADVMAANAAGQTPLHVALRPFAEFDVVAMEALLDAGGVRVLEARDRHGKTPLHLAAEYRKIQAIDRLLRAMRAAGVDVATLVNVPDNDGNTPLHLAAGCRGCLSGDVLIYQRSLQMLLREGADVEARNARGQTAYDLALENATLPNSPAMANILRALAPVNEEQGTYPWRGGGYGPSYLGY